MLNALLLLKLLILLALANGAPVMAKNILGSRFAFPVDGNLRFLDQKPVLGSSKTLRGIVASIGVTSVGAILLGLELRVGLLVSVYAMIGDIFSSFVKRRLSLAPSSKATGLDQIPESLLPLLACRSMLSLSVASIVILVMIFLILEMLISKVLYRYHLRDRPY